MVVRHSDNLWVSRCIHKVQSVTRAYLFGKPSVAVNLKVITLIINDFGSLRCISVIPNKPVLKCNRIRLF